MAKHALLNGSGNWEFMGARTPGWFCNLGFETATTSEAADSIKITGGDGSDLSSTNPLKITLPSTTSGILTMIEVTANVTIDLTGAHWGLGTNGDFTDVQLRVYAINDTGSIKWGVSLEGGKRTIASADSSATATSITAKDDMLVNSALNSGTWPCVEVGWFNADFDDTGGASEDLWAIQSSVGDLNVGIPVPDQTDWASFTPTHGLTGMTITAAGVWRRAGANMEVMTSLNCTAVTSPGGEPYIEIPSGYLIDTTTLGVGSDPSIGTGVYYDDSGSAEYQCLAYYRSNVSSRPRLFRSDATYAYGPAISSGVPVSYAVNDYWRLNFSVPILQWSSNTGAG